MSLPEHVLIHMHGMLRTDDHSAGNTWSMMAVSAVMALGGTLYSQYLQADILLAAPDHRRGVANSTMMLFQDVGGGVGAALFGAASEYLGYGFSFVAAGIVTLAVIPLAVLSGKKPCGNGRDRLSRNR